MFINIFIEVYLYNTIEAYVGKICIIVCYLLREKYSLKILKYEYIKKKNITLKIIKHIKIFIKNTFFNNKGSFW